LTFADWLKFSVSEELMYEIDILFLEKFLTNDALDFDLKPRLLDIHICLGHCFKAVTLPYLILIRRFRYKFV
jgi:hypothetical protein